MAIKITNDSTPILNERYRPSTVKDCIVKKSARKAFDKIVKTGEMKNMLFFGPPGSGKTTSARALCNDLGLEYIIINASDERTLEVVRERTKNFATTTSMNGKPKCIILDEADHLMPATQAAFRNAIEEYSSNCNFIFTCNYPSRIIDAIKSRLILVDFAAEEKELEDMQGEMFERVNNILANDGVDFSPEVVLEVVLKLYPDNRKILDLISFHIDENNALSIRILDEIKYTTVNDLVGHIKADSFPDIRKWCADNSNDDLSDLYGKLYKALGPVMDSDCLPEVILSINDYQRYDSVVPDKELHLVALCIELSATCKWK